MTTLPKATIKREIKSHGHILKRTVDETVSQIQYYLSHDDTIADITVVTLLWSLGFTPAEARESADRLFALASPKDDILSDSEYLHQKETGRCVRCGNVLLSCTCTEFGADRFI